MHAPDGLLLLLLVGTVAALLLQSLRFRHQRRLAIEHEAVAARHEAAATREHERLLALRERSARAVAGEWGAREILVQAGFEVLGRQVAGSWTLHADGQPHTFDLRADYLVTDGERRYIAEVKTGQMATRLSHGATRRQLLEYWAAFDVEGVLLVDADQGLVMHVEVDPTARLAARTPGGTSRRPLLWLLAVVAVVAFVGGVAASTQLDRW